MPLVEETIDIAMDPESLFPIISDFEKYPEIMESVEQVNILERGDEYSVSEWVTKVEGRTIKWIEKDYIKSSENRIDFELVKGDVKTYGGYWLLENKGSVTTVTFSIHFGLGIPMFASVLHPILAKKLRENMKQMLEDLKKRAEE